MKENFLKPLMAVAMMLALPMFFTSCTGEADNPVPVVPDVPLPDPDVDTYAAMMATPLTFEAAVAGATVTFTIHTTLASNPVECSTDGETWTAYTTETPITLSAVGDKVSFRATNAAYTDETDYSYFTCSDDCYLYGNIMSLISKDNFETEAELTADRTFQGMFYNNTHIKNHTDATKYLILSTTKMMECSYEQMFSGCTGLTATPVINVDCDGKKECLAMMFFGCSGLTKVSEGSQIRGTMGNDCCNQMFSSCSALTTVPSDFLPSTDLATSCYQSMFGWCKALLKAPQLPATTLAYNCYWGMFGGCTSLNEVWVKAEYTSDCESMFSNCTNAATNKFHTDGTQEAWTAACDKLSDWQFDAYPAD
jgi:hypothetical protein